MKSKRSLGNNCLCGKDPSVILFLFLEMVTCGGMRHGSFLSMNCVIVFDFVFRSLPQHGLLLATSLLDLLYLGATNRSNSMRLSQVQEKNASVKNCGNHEV